MIAMGLGPFRFAIDALHLRKIERKLHARHADIPLVNRPPTSQFLGPGKETIELPVSVFPIALPGSGLDQLEGMRQASAAGNALMLVAGTGRVLGRYTIREVEEDRDYLLDNGIAQKIDARIELVRYTPIGGIDAGGLFRLFG